MVPATRATNGATVRGSQERGSAEPAIQPNRRCDDTPTFDTAVLVGAAIPVSAAVAGGPAIVIDTDTDGLAGSVGGPSLLSPSGRNRAQAVREHWLRG